MSCLETLTNEELITLVSELQERVLLLEKEIASLRGGNPSPAEPRELPSFVKPNRKPREETKKPHKGRPHGFARRRQSPTRVVEHYPECCSTCGRKLFGGWLHTSRQIIDIPRAPVEIIEHRFMARHCGVCGRRELARPDLSGEVLGKSRLGVRLMSLIAYLDTVCRLPIATIQSMLGELYGLQVSQGEIVGVLHRIAAVGKQDYEDLLSQARHSSVLNADETGSREDGINGYVWSLCTPDIRFYHRDASRGSQVIKDLLGYGESGQEHKSSNAKPPKFRGKLITDFYSAYQWYRGQHQCCLVHLDRDLDDLKAKNAEDTSVCKWVEEVLALIQRAKDYHNDNPAASLWQRRRQRSLFQDEAQALAHPYSQSVLPQRVLAKRICKHLWQLFVFVEHPEVSPDNNAAERSIRPFVVLRKVSGGTRSAAGSNTQVVLLSLFGTWLLRGKDLLQSCQQMLMSGPARAPG